MWLGFGGEKNEKKIGIKHNDNTYITKIFIEAMRPNSWSDWLFVSRKAAKPVAVVTFVSKVILHILPTFTNMSLVRAGSRNDVTRGSRHSEASPEKTTFYIYFYISFMFDEE